jgi:dihydroceramide fatty acyl 2-hydroxylase
MFDSWFLETFSKTPWWTVPLLWLPVVARSFAVALGRHAVPRLACAAYLLLGLLAWSVVEYALHRFVFHSQPSQPWAITLHFSLHGCHHKRPMDRLRLVFPPLFAAPVVAFFWAVWTASAGEGPGVALFGGMLLGYVTYDVTHYMTHYAKETNGWLAYIRRVHLAHHFVDPGTSFGVSSDVIDRICGTRPSNKKARN